MPAVRLSILIPIYNEGPSLRTFLERAVAASASYSRAAGIVVELIVVDDGSQDDSCQRVEAFSRAHPDLALRLFRYQFNCGKGAAIRAAISFAEGDFCLTQDAGFEYDPSEYQQLLRPLLSDQADVVLGSRFMAASQRRPVRFWPAAANRFISALTGMVAGLQFSDVDSGCKAFRTSLAKSIPLHSRRAGLGAELLIQFARRHARFVEVPISSRSHVYEKRTKRRAWRALSSIWSILRTSLLSAPHNDPAASILVALSRAKRFNQWMADTINTRVIGDVLELGAGIGNLTILLSANGNPYVATDSEKEHLSELHSRTANRPNVKVGICDFSKIEDVTPYCLTADTVICLNTLEHIADDREGLANIYSCVRPGGTVIILVPQGPAAFGSLDRLLDHKRRYTRMDLHEKMAASGFHTIQIIDFNHATWPGWYLNSRLLRRRSFGRLQLFLFDLLVPLWRRIDHLLPWPPNSLIGIGIARD